ncbi:hypothetical protein BGW80DRAFT_1351294 [Lactifluus volemus]|nr:hypothetical protein BGW80DRAFT_1351294 [Lactifluus volemus]
MRRCRARYLDGQTPRRHHCLQRSMLPRTTLTTKTNRHATPSKTPLHYRALSLQILQLGQKCLVH